MAIIIFLSEFLELPVDCFRRNVKDLDADLANPQ
jgi:hypothetical protein